MTEYEFKNAKVRLHGTADEEKLKAATMLFLKKSIERKRENEKKNKESNT